jgi:excisionase family DNA binding protein
VVEKVPVGPTPTLQESQGLASVGQGFGAMVVQSVGAEDPRQVTPRLLRVVGDWLTVKEAAALLKVSTATAYKLVREGKLEHVRVGNSIRVLR